MFNNKELKFKTYLYNYVKYLSFSNSVNIRKLSNEMKENPRLKEVFFLYLVFNDKEDSFVRLNQNEKLAEEYKGFRLRFKTKQELIEMLDKEINLDISYIKIFQTYKSERDKKKNEEALKEKLVEKILDLKNKTKVSDYRLCKSLNLNAGNLHELLYKNNYSKVSLENCMRIQDFIEERQMNG